MASPECVNTDSLEGGSSGEGMGQTERSFLKKLKALFMMSRRNGQSSDEDELSDADRVSGVQEDSRDQGTALRGIPVLSGLRVFKKTKAFLRKAKGKFANQRTGNGGDVSSTDADAAFESSAERDAEKLDNADSDMISQRIETNGPSQKAQYYLKLHKDRALKGLNIGAKNVAQSGPSEAARKYLNFHANRVLKIPLLPLSSSPTFDEDRDAVTVESSPQGYAEGIGLGGRKTELTSNEREKEAVTDILGIRDEKLSPSPDSPDGTAANESDDVLESMADTTGKQKNSEKPSPELPRWEAGISAIEDVQNSSLTPRKRVEDVPQNDQCKNPNDTVEVRGASIEFKDCNEFPAQKTTEQIIEPISSEGSSSCRGTSTMLPRECHDQRGSNPKMSGSNERNNDSCAWSCVSVSSEDCTAREEVVTLCDGSCQGFDLENDEMYRAFWQSMGISITMASCFLMMGWLWWVLF